MLALPLLVLAVPLPAQAATTYCVPSPCSPGTQEASISDALAAAAGDPDTDTINLQPVTFTGAQVGPTGTAADAVGNPVHIVGAGQSQTILPSPASSFPALTIDAPNSTISSLQVALASGDGRVALRTFGNADHITVSFSDASAIGVSGIGLSGSAILSNSDVAVPQTFQSSAIVGIAGGTWTDVRITDSTLAGTTAVRPGGPTTVQRVTASSKGFAFNAGPGTSIELQDSVVRLLPGPPPFSSPVPPSPLAATAFTAGTAGILARNTTLIGSGDASTAGAVAYTDGGPDRMANVDIHDSILRNFANSLFTTQAAGGGSATIKTDFSDYDASTNNTSGGGSITFELNHLNVDPQFAGPSDFHLLSSSPLIDAGTPDPLGPSESTTDLDRGPRLLDGNGDCAVRRDIGAYEFSPSSLTATASASAATAGVGQPVSFNGSSSCDPDPTLTPSLHWSFDDGSSADGAVVSHAFATLGQHTATLTVSDSAGRSGSASVTVTVKDLTPPETKLGKAKINRSAHKAKFKFSANEPGSKFLCKLDRKGFKSCSSPKTYKNLKPGKHTFQVKARDAAGNEDQTPAKKKFRI